MTDRLRGKNIIATGGAGGIGLAVVETFLHEGACCTVADIGPQPSPGLVALQEEFADRLIYVETNVVNAAQIERLLDAAEHRFGTTTTVFNNAAIFDMAPFLESNEESYERLFAVNVKGMFFMMQKALARMVAAKVQGGAVINMASQAGRRGESMVSHYCATKAAVISYTQSAAMAMAPHRIRVNAISPGVISTPMWVSVDAKYAHYENLPIGEKKRQVGASVPLGYMGEPKDICGAAIFLASDEASYVTAQTLNVDGGNVMS
ncbi:L-iditol 2-dehydrogenase [Variovorax sp. ZS18.2.2]|uniref:L-iditol 2-dehydrogenase n=1 Tax=Variovorax sp. ZS18.2.2 TaxID=2971255 RepID=UPI002150AEEF|nr:L-iditol 2-dehydrogenase [Variovorax sp. ZS18.2.2]MCR6477826.1 L-iditol 2-dehydrogenase [Variovorax sp. ZS18.2.2]